MIHFLKINHHTVLRDLHPVRAQPLYKLLVQQTAVMGKVGQNINGVSFGAAIFFHKLDLL